MRAAYIIYFDNATRESKNMAVHVFFFIFSLYLCTQARLREPECRCSGATFVGKTLALAIIQNVQKLAGGKNTFT